MRQGEEALTAGSPSTKRPFQKTKTPKSGPSSLRQCFRKLQKYPLRNRPYCRHQVLQRRFLCHEQHHTSSTSSAIKHQRGKRCCLVSIETGAGAPTSLQLPGSSTSQYASKIKDDSERTADSGSSVEHNKDAKINRFSFNDTIHLDRRDLPDANDLESSAGLVRNTAFRVESREYHHPAPVPGPQSMENRLSLEVSSEKLGHQDDANLVNSTKSPRTNHRRTDDIKKVLGLRSTSFNPENAIGCCERSLEYEKENVLDNTAFNDGDKDENDRRIVETNACLDVPGGRLFAIVCHGRSFTNGCQSTGSPKHSFVSNKKSEYPCVNEIPVGYDCRTCGSSDDREKWKKPRRRRRRKWSESKRRRLDECWKDEDVDNDNDGYKNEDSDDDDEYENEDEDVDERLLSKLGERDEGARNDNTARSGDPIVERNRKRRRKKRRRRGSGGRGRGSGGGKWSGPCKEKTKMEESRKKFEGCNKGERRFSRGISSEGGLFRSEKRSSRKWGVRSYGLLLVLYLLALPILCSTDSSAPVASAFAQKSPLTHGDNFTARNSSSQHQGNHQMRRDGVMDDDMPHPYNEYTWEINQINPWLSACDLAGPAPADLQGSCGPPEVPKSCPLRCSSNNQADSNRAFGEVIEMFGINERARSGAGGSRWRPAGTTTTNKSGNKIKDDDRKNKRTEETVNAAPVQCLFYLEASHKRDICRDNFGRGSSLSFSNTRENRYWYLSALRLRHCCERAVVNALAPGKGGPLEDVLNGGPKCSDALDKLLVVDALAARLHCEFEEVLARYDCGQSYSVIHNCTHCKEAYRKWVCSSLVPYFAHGGPPALETSANTWLGSRLRPCRSFCQSVEQRCPYLLPGDRAPAYPTQYAGEPTFLCRDPNIPETGEQAMRALHGNEKDECCFHVCSEDEPGLGVCANCTDLKAPSNRAGHDIPTAPQCEITSTSSIQPGSTGEKNTDSRIGSASSVESSSASPSTSTTTSASFCGGGGVGSMPSSSGQSTTQTPPPSSISLICMFWIWAALISLCTGQTVFPWSPPSSLLMGDYSTRSGKGVKKERRKRGQKKKQILGRGGVKEEEEEGEIERETKPRRRTRKKMDIGKMAALSITCSFGSAPRSFSRSSMRLLVSRRRMRRDLSVILLLKFARVFLVTLTTIIMKNNYYRNHYIDLFNIVRQYSLVLLFMIVRYYEKCHFRLSRINYVLIIINESSSFHKRPHKIGYFIVARYKPAAPAAAAVAVIASSFGLQFPEDNYDYYYYCYDYYYYEAKFYWLLSPRPGQPDLERNNRKLGDYAPRPPRGKRRKRRRRWRRRRRRRFFIVYYFIYRHYYYYYYCIIIYADNNCQQPSFLATRLSIFPDYTKWTPFTIKHRYYHYYCYYYYCFCWYFYFYSRYFYYSSCNYYYNSTITWWWWWCWWWWWSSSSWSSFCIFLYPPKSLSYPHRDRPS